MNAQDKLTVMETAQLIGVTPQTVYALVKRGKLTKHRLPVGQGMGGRFTYFLRGEIESFLRGESPAPTPPPKKPKRGTRKP